MAVGGASGAGSGASSAGAGSAGKSGRAGGSGAAGKSKDSAPSPGSSTKADGASTGPTSTQDKASLSTETGATQTEEAKAKSLADNFESRFSAAFDDGDTSPEVEAAQQDLESALQDYTDAKAKSDPQNKGGIVDTAAGVTKAAAETVADAAKKARRGSRAMGPGSKVDVPSSVSRLGRATAGLAAGVSAVSGLSDLALKDAPVNDKLETALKAADDIASTAQMARSLGATSRFGIGTVGRMAPALGAGALAYEGVNQLATSQSRADTWAGGLKTAAAATMVGGMTSVIGAPPAAVASGAMYGTALAIDNWETIDSGINMGIDTLQQNFGTGTLRSQDPAYEKTVRGYRRI